MSMKPAKPIEIFYSYSHKDEELRDELEKHLSILKWQGVIQSWHDRRIGAGKRWEGEIDTHLNTADVILLLISSDFLASDYCYDVEMKRAMERHETGEARVIPVILRPVDWRGAPFGKLQALPKDAKPVASWPDLDEAFLNVEQGIRAAVEELVEPSVGLHSVPEKPPPDIEIAAPEEGFERAGLDTQIWSKTEPRSKVPRRWQVPRPFKGARGKFRGADFTERDDLVGADFSSADLTGANLQGVDLTSATFIDAILVQADLQGATLKDIDLSNANCRHMQFSSARQIVSDTRGWDTATWDEEAWAALQRAQQDT